MAKSNASKFALGAVIAGVAGYVTGILTAPKSGKETRQDMKRKASDVKNDAEAQLQKAEAELKELAAKARARGDDLTGKAKSEYQAAAAKAKNAQAKASAVLKAFRSGKAKNPELNAAVKQLREARKNLAKYIRA